MSESGEGHELNADAGASVPANPDRQWFAFALRDRLPLDGDGWTVMLHHPECASSDDPPVLACFDGAPCYASLAQFIPFRETDGSVTQAIRDLMTVAAAAGGAAHAELPEDVASDVEQAFTFDTFRWVIVTSIVDRHEENAELFETSFGVAADALVALRLATGAPIPDLSIERVYPFYLAGRAGSDDVPALNQLSIVKHVRPGPYPTATPEQFERATHLFEALGNDNPVVRYRDLAQVAKHAAHVEGDYPKAVLTAAVACEVLVKMAAWMLTFEAGAMGEDPAPGARTAGLAGLKPRQLIGSVLQPRLGGNWAANSAATPVGAWREHVARVRNRHLHRGERVSALMADEAVLASRSLETHVADRLAARAATYPRTALALVGVPGLERRGQLSAFPAELLEDGAVPAEFVTGYVEFVAGMDDDT